MEYIIEWSEDWSTQGIANNVLILLRFWQVITTRDYLVWIDGITLNYWTKTKLFLCGNQFIQGNCKATTKKTKTFQHILSSLKLISIQNGNWWTLLEYTHYSVSFLFNFSNIFRSCFLFLHKIDANGIWNCCVFWKKKKKSNERTCVYISYVYILSLILINF